MKNPLEVRLRTIHVGSIHRVTLLAIEGRCPAQEFLETLHKTDPRRFDNVLAKIRTIAEQKIVRNEYTLKRLGEGLFEIKTKKAGVRLYVFYDDFQTQNLVIATNGGDKSDQSGDIAKARKIMTQYRSLRDRFERLGAKEVDLKLE